MTETHGSPRLSVIVPMHNSSSVIADTIQRWREYLNDGYNEIVLVENGSSDDTWAIVQREAIDTEHVHFVLMQSEKGMGNALRAGILECTGEVVLLTADDLPFSFGDVEQFRAIQAPPMVVIGSKAHPESQIDRAKSRGLFTRVFRTLRQLVLRTKVGDSQGTIFVDGPWVRSMAHLINQPGFLFTTQLIYAAELQGVSITEVPVTLASHHTPKPSSIRFSDIWDMGAGLYSLRLGKRRLKSSPAAEQTLAATVESRPVSRLSPQNTVEGSFE